MPPPSPTRLAFCITDLDAGGAESALVQLATRLDRSRWEPRVYCLSGPGELVAPLEDADIPVTCLDAGSARQLGAVLRLRRELRAYRPAIVQTFLFHANLAGRIAARLAGVEHVVSGIRVAERRGRWPLRLDRWTNRLVERNVCVSEAVRKFSEEQGGLPAAKSVVIPNAVDVDHYASVEPADLWEFGITDRARTILFVGRLTPQKSPLTLLQAAEQLFPLYENLHLLFVGEGALLAELKAWVAERNLERNVHFAGRRNDVPALMRSTFCLVLPSLWEGMPNVVLEAMAAGLPVVASRVEGVEELIEDGRTGLLVSPRSDDELASALTGLLDDPEFASRLGMKAQVNSQSRLTWDEVARKYDALYRELLGAR